MGRVSGGGEAEEMRMVSWVVKGGIQLALIDIAVKFAKFLMEVIDAVIAGYVVTRGRPRGRGCSPSLGG